MSEPAPYVALRLSDPTVVDRLAAAHRRLFGDGEAALGDGTTTVDALISSLLDRADERRRLANYIGLPWDASEGAIRAKIEPLRVVVERASMTLRAGRLDRSPRLQRVRDLLLDGREYSTLEIVQGAHVCAVNSIVSELRANGLKIACRVIVAPNGERTWLYRLISDAPAGGASEGAA